MITEFLETKNIHFVGIGGIGVSAIARFFVARGANVSGSDVGDFDGAKELQERGIKIFLKQDAKNLPEGTGAVVYSAAVPTDDVELSLAREKGIPLYTYVEALGEIMRTKYGIGVSGTNGKTTTTAMLGKILEEGGIDPMVIVGGKVPGWDANLRLPILPRTPLGNNLPRGVLGGIFVAEACEYRRHFLKLSPKSIVLTNIEAEHLDYFKDIEDIKSAFFEYVGKLPEDGLLVYNVDDANVVSVVKNSKAKKVSYGIKNDADLRGEAVHYEKGEQLFSVTWKGNLLGEFSIGVPGLFNVYNALAAMACALSFSVLPDVSKAALKKFTGTWRRFEKKGIVGGALIISDYAHHPAGVRATIDATKELYPNKKILVVFQPHQKDRTLKLLHEFAEALAVAPSLILSEIYEVAGRNETEKNISSRDLAREVEKISEVRTIFAGTLEETEKKVRELLSDFDVVLFMGAGDIYKVANNLTE